MNYFEFYEMPESFKPDATLLKKKFYELSKRYHPDFYANDDEAKQQEILQLSTLNNKAFQVLSNPAKRIEYLLQLHGLLEDGDKYKLDPDFLMAMMEINEGLSEAETPEQIEALKTQVDSMEAVLQNQLDILIADDEMVDVKLKNIKDIYYRHKYLLRIKDTLNTFATRN